MIWRAARRPAADYTLFVHLVDRDGKRWGQHDGYPTGGELPTSRWLPGSMLRSSLTVPVDAAAPPGQYRLLIGLYDLHTMQRLPAEGGGVGPDNAVATEVVEIRSVAR